MAIRAPSAAEPEPEPRQLARGGLLGFAGAASSAILGFLFTVVLARTLGDSGTGIMLQAIAVFTIVLSFGRAGMDSVAVWLLPRLVVADVGRIRGVLVFLLVIAAAAGSLGAFASSVIVGAFPADDPNASRVAEAVTAIAWFLPAAAVLLVALAATRGLGSVLAYAAVGGFGLPAVRLIVVAAVATGGGSLIAVAVSWAAPLPVALATAVIVLAVQCVRHERGISGHGDWWPPARTRRLIGGYAVPRLLSAGLEQAILWLDVLIVGAILGSAAAGVYGGASRFVAAGLIVDTAIRVVVSPRFSVMIGQGQIAGTQALYRTAARWLVLFSAPIYLILAIHAPVVLAWLGPGFAEGASALAILSIGAIITLMAGNIHSVLLMSGRSGWAAFNKVVVLVINVAGNLLLLPLIGITGAAISWAASMLIDAILASVEVRRLVGVRVDPGSIGYAIAIPLLSIGAPALLIRTVWGSSTTSLLLSLAAGTVLFLAWCLIDGRRLQLRDLSIFVRDRS